MIWVLLTRGVLARVVFIRMSDMLVTQVDCDEGFGEFHPVYG
jgi:hypothetical protein